MCLDENRKYRVKKKFKNKIAGLKFQFINLILFIDVEVLESVSEFLV